MQRLMIKTPKIYERIKEASFTPGAGMALLIVLGLYILYFLLREIPANIIDLVYYSGQTARNQLEAQRVIHDYITAPGTMLASLAMMAVLPAITIVYVRKFEKRPLSTIGTARPGLNRFALGYLGGLALFLAAVLPEAFAETVQYKGAAPVALLFIFGYIVQAASEEIFFRGYLLSSLTERISAVPAVLISSALFAGLRAWNHSASGLMIPELFLSGVLYALLTLRTGSIWAAAGMHAVKSFTYGLVSPVVLADLETDYSALSLSGGGADIYLPLISMAACTVIIAFILFAGENRLAVPLSDERRMYLKAKRTAKDVLRGVCGDDGVPLKRLGFSIAASLQSYEAKTAALLYVMRLNGAEFLEEDYRKDMLGTVEMLLSGKGVSIDQTALEVRHAAEKRRGALKERYKKYARQTNLVYCPLLRRETDKAVCANTMAAVDGGNREGLFAVMDIKVCLNCSRR